MFSSVQCAVEWAATTLGVRACTYLPMDATGGVDADEKTFVVVERTGGELDYPHDNPEISFQVWSRSEADAEAYANMLAIAARTKMMADRHVNAMGVPSVLSYGREDGGWFVWQVTQPLSVNLLD